MSILSTPYPMLDDGLEIVRTDQCIRSDRNQTDNKDVCICDLLGNTAVRFGGVITAHEIPPVSRDFIWHPAMFAKAG